VQAPGPADRQARAADCRRRLPLPATAPGVGARVTGAASEESEGSEESGEAEGAAQGGVLYVVATPIGNLGDVTLRALEVLRGVPLIAAEDTRHTRRLLDRHAVATRTTSYHAQSDASRTTALLEHLR